jgi:hypothetical protein
MVVVFVQLVNSPQLERLLVQRALQAKLQRAMDYHRARLVLLVNTHLRNIIVPFVPVDRCLCKDRRRVCQNVHQDTINQDKLVTTTQQ